MSATFNSMERRLLAAELAFDIGERCKTLKAEAEALPDPLDRIAIYGAIHHLCEFAKHLLHSSCGGELIDLAQFKEKKH